MSSTRFFTFIVLLGMLLVASQAQTTYLYTFDSLRMNSPSYSLGYILSNYTVMLNLSTPGTTTGFSSSSFIMETD